jgi:hypothetical protein
LYHRDRNQGARAFARTRRPALCNYFSSWEFGPTDILFAAAGVEHRFENFSGDLTLWVLFYGPEGGESNSYEIQEL